MAGAELGSNTISYSGSSPLGSATLLEDLRHDVLKVVIYRI